MFEFTHPKKNSKPIYVFNSNTYNLAKKKQLTFYLTVKKQVVNNVYTDTYATCIAWKLDVGVKGVKKKKELIL